MNEKHACPNGTESYIIQEGDSLYQIAEKFNISLDSLLRANPYINPYMLFVGQIICIPKMWNSYSNDELNVSFMYPATWNETSEDKYEGDDGFFQLAAIGTQRPVNKVCRHEAFNRKRNYGSNPKFISIQIENQNGYLIYPSFDQDQDMDNISALIVRYPKPIRLDHKVYNYLILWCSKGYIRHLGNTLRFNRY